MERNPPDWLNKEFLAEALQKEGRHGIVTVTKFAAKPASTVGDNYTSYMFRINLTFREGTSDEKEEVLILKAPIATGLMKDFPQMFEEEPNVYNKILPKMYKKLKIQIGPKAYHSSMQGALLLKDLKVDGYTVCDRFKQLDFKHCKLVYETLAKYHATSVALHNDDPELIEDLGKERHFVTDSNTPVFKQWMNSSLKNFVEVIKEMDVEKTMIEFLESNIDGLWDSLVRICQRNPKRLNVLSHGDCWTNNMLFKHNSDQEVVDIKLIDFQIPRYNSEAVDVIHFFWTSANEDVRKNRQKDVFEIYLHTLNKTLEQLGCEERLTFEQLEEDLKEVTEYLLWIVSFVHLFTFSEPELALDMSKFSMDDFSSGVVEKKVRAIYNGKRYRALLPGIVRDLQTWLSSRGIIANRT